MTSTLFSARIASTAGRGGGVLCMVGYLRA
jgi:hypothetical protein